jgi:hypothetical protein
MPDDPIDLTPLDPDADPSAEDRFVSSVMSRIAAGANPYPMRVDLLWGVWLLGRPVLVAVSVAILIAGISIVRARRDEARAPLTVAESLGVPPQFQRAMVTPASDAAGRSR